ncbi:MAG: hypothetical protein GX817_05220 [Elusimicrobia bacterium]|nr:hypothetical protein [Elusimicrobiota bacterium]
MDTEYNQESSTLLLPINLGLETSLSEKLSLRAGFAKDLINRRKSVSKEGLFNTTTNPGGPFTKEGQVDEEMIVDNVIGNATITLGIGWDVLENVTIDAVLRQEVLFTGGYLLSGVPETLASQLTATLRY